MAHGVKPYGRTQAQSTIFGVQDMGELAGRLWSPNTFNRSGELVWMDGFEGSLNKWFSDGSGLGWANNITNERARNGLCSCHMVAGSTINHLALLSHAEPYPALSSFGAELSFSLRGTQESFGVALFVLDGMWQTEYHVRWRDVINDLQYLDAWNVWQTFAVGVTLYNNQPSLFHTMKLVVDGTLQAYRYFILNNNSYPLPNIQGWTIGGGPDPLIYMNALLTGRLANNDECWVDDAIITQNEP